MNETKLSGTAINGTHNSGAHNIAFLGFDGVQLLDLIGPLEAFKLVNTPDGEPRYNTFIVSNKPVFTSGTGVRVVADKLITDPQYIDTLVVPGGEGTREPEIFRAMKPWLDRQFERTQRILSICTGIFLLADQPYLAGREVATHWAFSALLQGRNPQLKVNHERLFIKQGKFYSSAGVLSGIDLALNIIEEDCGVEVAAHVAKYLVTYLKRSGFQSQFSEPLKFQFTDNSKLKRINKWLIENLSSPFTIAQLAKSVHISERHLNRLVQGEFHMSASKYVEHIRLEQAKNYLTKPSTSIDCVARQVGFASPDSFRRSFKRKYGIHPTSYSKRFQ